jgi:hypothetical protein
MATVPGQIVYIGSDGNPTGNVNLTFEDINSYPGTRLDTKNLGIDNTTSIGGNVGIGTATARENLEVTGYSIFNAQGTNSQNENEFGLNGKFDTLSLLTPIGIGVQATTSIFFGLNSHIYYPMGRIVVRDDNGDYTASMAFQTGRGNSLVERMRIDTNGYVGIGLSTPKYTLDVKGTANVQGISYVHGAQSTIGTTNVSLFAPKMIAVGYNGDNLPFQTIKYSKDNGATWNNILSGGFKTQGIAVAWNGTIWVAVGQNDLLTEGLIQYSYDGVYWTISTVENTDWSYGLCIAWNGTMWIAGGTGQTKYSYDGVYWKDLPMPLTNMSTIAWNGNVWVSGFSTNKVGFSFIYYSYDGFTWIATTARIWGKAVVWNGSMFVMTGNDLDTVNTIQWSNDGINWFTASSGGFSSNSQSGYGGNCIAWNGKTWVVGGQTYNSVNIPRNGNIQYSYDGKNWLTAVSHSFNLLVNGISWNGTKWIAVGKNSIIQKYNEQSSSDGLYWIEVGDTPIFSPGGNGISSGLIGIGGNALTVGGNLLVDGPTDLNGDLNFKGGKMLYTTCRLSLVTNGSIYLNFPNISVIDSIMIDVTLSIGQSGTNSNTSAKFTVYLYSYNGIGLWINNITVNTNGTGYFGPLNISTNTYSPNGLSVEIVYTNVVISQLPPVVTVNYVVYGEASKYIKNIHLTEYPLVPKPATPTEPDPPTNVVATAGPGQATVSWSAPASNGGSVITGYTVSWLGGSQLLSGTSTTITGLTNGTPYTFTVYASNTIGNSGVTTSNSVIPVAPPGAPTNVVATGGNGQATLTWLAPANNGGSAIIDYFISYSGGSTTSSGTSTTITGLSNGSPYTFTVYARNSVGSSTGTTSNTVTPVSIVYAFSNVTFPGATFTGTSYYTVDQTINMSWNINWTFPTVYSTEVGSLYTTFFSGNSAELNYPYSGYLITSVIIYARNASNNTLIATSQRFQITFNYNF